jgi:hypothetical protein
MSHAVNYLRVNDISKQNGRNTFGPKLGQLGHPLPEFELSTTGDTIIRFRPSPGNIKANGMMFFAHLANISLMNFCYRTLS